LAVANSVAIGGVGLCNAVRQQFVALGELLDDFSNGVSDPRPLRPPVLQSGLWGDLARGWGHPRPRVRPAELNNWELETMSKRDGRQAPQPLLALVVMVSLLIPLFFVGAEPSPAEATRVGGSVVLYEFGEGSGDVVRDVSGVGPALDLRAGGVFSWGEGGLTLSSATVASEGPAVKVVDAVRASGEFTVEAWVTPANVTQEGPARIVASEGSSTSRNFMLGQGMYSSFPDDVFSSRVRTSTKLAGNTVFTSAGSATTSLTHVVLTRSASGVEVIYVDGVERSSTVLGGSLANWDRAFPLVVGSLPDGSRPWAGTVCLVAVFDRALSSAEVGGNYSAGCDRDGAPGNRAPVVTSVGDQVSVVGEAVSVPVAASDPDGDELAFSAVGLPDGLGIDAVSGEITGTPTSVGVSVVTVTVDDGQATTDTTFTWTIAAASSPPVANDDEYSTDEDVPLVAGVLEGVLANDVSPGGEALEAVLVSDVSSGSVQLAADGSFTYTPTADFFGSDSFTYRASTGTQLSDVATARITVRPIPDPPVARDDGYRVAPDGVLAVEPSNGVLANDSDPDFDALSAVLVDDVSNGTLALSPDGSFVYEPSPGFSGTDTFTYRASDGVLLSSPATVTIAVEAATVTPEVVRGVGFQKQVAGTGLDETHAAAAADLDGDGDVDLIGTAYLSNAVFWYENDGSGNFTTRVIDDDLRGAYPVHVADVDLDGDVDVLAIGFLSDTVAWYENDGSGSFTKRVVTTTADGGHSVVAGDIDQDGDVDLLVGTELGDTVLWFENDGNEVFTEHLIDGFSNGSKDAKLADIDGDGDLDVVGGNCFGREVNWYENDGNEVFTERLIDGAARCAYFVTPADLDGDGDMDVVAALRDDNAVVWYENDGNESFTRRTIDGNAVGARTAVVADVDGDGDLDVIAASADDDTLGWYENRGGGRFSAQPIDLAAAGAYGVFPADVDGDGVLDVVAAVRDADTLEVFYGLVDRRASVVQGGRRVIDVALTGPSGASVQYELTRAPTAGQLQRGGVPLVVGDRFSGADVAAGAVAYVHAGLGTLPDMFEFAASDDGTTTSGRVTLVVVGPSDLRARLSFDEGSGLTSADSSGAGNDGTLLNGAAFDPQTPDGSPFALALDGTNDYVDLGAFDAAGSGLTLSSWFNADRYPGSSRDPRLISKATGSAENEHVFMLGTVRVGTEVRLRARVRVGGATTTLIATEGSLGIGTWYHAAVTHDGNVIRLFLDGEEVGSTFLLGAVDQDPSVPVSVGGQAVGPSSRFFDGRLDDAIVAQRAFTAAEVRALAGSP
jgi:hypothetical protein